MQTPTNSSTLSLGNKIFKSFETMIVGYFDCSIRKTHFSVYGACSYFKFGE